MAQFPLFSGIWNYLTAPDLPRTALAMSENHLALVSLRRSGGEFEPRNLGVLRLPAGLIRAGFTEPNVADEAALADHLTRTAAQAGLTRLRNLSATLPAGSARSLVVTLESVPGSRVELKQMMEWKIERSLGQKSSELRLDYGRLRDFNGRPQWLVSAVHEQVAVQYERVFKQLNWTVGLLAPQHLGEAQWLIRAGLDEDQVVVSLHDGGFDAVIVRGKEPILVREVSCTPEERENEFFRLMVFYRDRLLPENAPVTLSRVLTIGGAAEQRRFREVVSEALDKHAVALDASQLGFRVDPSAPFIHFAAAGGLATMAWG